MEGYLETMLTLLPSLFTKMKRLRFTEKLVNQLKEKFAALQAEMPWQLYIRFRSGSEVRVCVCSNDLPCESLRNGSYQRYERKGRKYSIEEILPLLRGKQGKKSRTIILDGDRIKVSSVRLLTFSRHGIKCVKCGMEGVFFVKERHRKSNDDGFHLNLYGFNEHGSEVLMTSDHIIPRSKGGSEGVLNRQPMCIHCNNKKADNFDDEDVKHGVYKHVIS